MTKETGENPVTNLFQQQLIAALTHFKDPTWLGNHSPLATPYFLGEYLLRPRGENNTAVRRGQVLQKLLHETAQSLREREEDGHYLYRLLDLTFFRPHPLAQILHELNISKSTYYRPGHRPRAIQKLEQALIQQLKPTLRLEEPPVPLPDMLGRKTVVAQCQRPLQKGQTLAIVGSGGLGKTTLGAFLAAQWQPQPTFWFTLRPGLNDQLGSFLFLLGFFLQREGAASLWLQVAIRRMLTQAAIELSPNDLTALQAYTDGNPRLLKLFITLHGAGEPLADVLPRMSTAPSLEFILNRIWRHLDEKAQNLLAFLSVFRRAVPCEAWLEPAVLSRLAMVHTPTSRN